MSTLQFFPMRDLENLDLEAMSEEELVELQERILEHMEGLSKIEPEDMESEAFETWAARYEFLEDLTDDIAELLGI